MSQKISLYLLMQLGRITTPLPKLLQTSVLEANNPRKDFRTVCLRICSIYGERDQQMIPGTLQAFHQRRTHIQLGINANLFDILSATNATTVHILAAQCLLRTVQPGSKSKVDEEAFFITDGRPVFFWDFSRKIWKAAGDTTPQKTIKVIPVWFILSLAITVVWLCWIFTLG